MMNNTENQAIVEEIFSLYDQYGQADYIGEAISQIEHASQSGELALQQTQDDEVILAAFFHDIGHICLMHQKPEKMGEFGIIRHEKLGADFLRARGFSEKIAQLVENHVQAKRYLTFKHPEYYAQLSEASKNTLEHQGGKMTATEAEAFEADELFEVSIQMRKWDELAKEVNIPLLDFNILKEKALKHLQKEVS